MLEHWQICVFQPVADKYLQESQKGEVCVGGVGVGVAIAGKLILYVAEIINNLPADK